MKIDSHALSLFHDGISTLIIVHIHQFIAAAAEKSFCHVFHSRRCSLNKRFYGGQMLQHSERAKLGSNSYGVRVRGAHV